MDDPTPDAAPPLRTADTVRQESPNTPAAPGTPGSPAFSSIALVGNPNTGKTTLFNRLCGMRAKTANFPGSTVEARVGKLTTNAHTCEVVDLPGVYGLNLDLPEATLCRDYLEGAIASREKPDALIIVVDATNLSRNLRFVAQALSRNLPAIVALNMVDLAQRGGLTIDADKLARHLGCPVVPICARSGQGVDQLRRAITSAAVSDIAAPDAPDTDDHAALAAWSDTVVETSVGGDSALGGREDTLTERIDLAFTHPVLGALVFTAIMAGLFYTIFALATVPMDLIDATFSHLGGWLGDLIPEGAVHDLVVDGVVAGIAGTVVFLPQICLLFFLISLLEDTGYLARAAFVMDRLLRRFGLPGQAFVPLLSAHACAIPAIMSARLIPDHKDRLTTVLVAPFLSCSARLPVYVLLISVLFTKQPFLAGLAFVGCYALGAMAALFTAVLCRRTLLKGSARPMVLELPSYKMPSIRSALLTTFDRGLLFLRKAGTVILSMCIVLWWLGTYPRSDPPPEVDAMRAQAAQLESTDKAAAQDTLEQADRLEKREAIANSFIGHIGRGVEPVMRPLGYDWQLSIGVLSSFAAREVFVSTMAIVLSAGPEDADIEDPSVLNNIKNAKRDDGRDVFTTATAASLLVFYVLAMQCLPTLAVTRRETGSWKWAGLQLGYMTALAYAFAAVTYWAVRLGGVA